MIPSGKCRKCGELYFGQALNDPKKRFCSECGGPIAVKLYPDQREVSHAEL